MVDNDNVSLDYEDNLMSTRREAESVISVQHSEDQVESISEGRADRQMDRDKDLGLSEVWREQQCQLVINKEKCEHLCKCLE